MLHTCLEMEGTNKAKPRDVSFGRKKALIPKQVKELQPRRAQGIVIKRLCKATASQKPAYITACLYLTPFSAYSSHDLWKKAFCGDKQTNPGDRHDQRRELLPPEPRYRGCWHG